MYIWELFNKKKMAEKKENQASPTNSDNNDSEFVVTAEMMIDEEDYENTLDEEEELEDEDEDELADLQKEGDMPIEELLAMYYKSDKQTDTHVDGQTNHNESPRKSITTHADRVNEEEEELEMKQDDGSSHSSSADLRNHQDDEMDPFQNQRITRGLAALNSQYFDDDYSSDEDYQPAPPTEDWKKEIQIGDNYQAEVDENLSPYTAQEKTLDSDDRLLWTPSVISPEKLTSYLDLVYKLSDFGSQHSDRDDEQALFTLLQTRDVNAALQKRQEQDRQPPDVSLWSEEECQNFEQGLRVFGKDFCLIQKNKVQTRTVGEIVQFYYLWKKTERHDAFVTQTKLGRRKYTLPGIADMMGRFMEENESLFSSRSESPSHETSDYSKHHDNAYTNHNDHTLEPPIKRERLDPDDDFYDNQKENVYNSSTPAAPSYHTNNLSYTSPSRVVNGRAPDEGWRTSNSSSTISLAN